MKAAEQGLADAQANGDENAKERNPRHLALQWIISPPESHFQWPSCEGQVKRFRDYHFHRMLHRF